MRKKHSRNVHCKVCRKRLDQLELNIYEKSNKKICLDCENQELDEVGIQQDEFAEELKSV